MATSHRLSVHPFNADSLPRLNDPTLLSGGRLFTWEEFLSRRAGYPSKNGQLFQHEQFLGYATTITIIINNL